MGSHIKVSTAGYGSTFLFTLLLEEGQAKNRRRSRNTGSTEDLQRTVKVPAGRRQPRTRSLHQSFCTVSIEADFANHGKEALK